MGAEKKTGGEEVKMITPDKKRPLGAVSISTESVPKYIINPNGFYCPLIKHLRKYHRM